MALFEFGACPWVDANKIDTYRFAIMVLKRRLKRYRAQSHKTFGTC